MSMLADTQIQIKSLSSWFTDRLNKLKCSPELKAYVCSVLAMPLVDSQATSQSIVLMYAGAVERLSFKRLQETGDTVVRHTTTFGDFTHRDTYLTVGRLSYAA